MPSANPPIMFPMDHAYLVSFRYVDIVNPSIDEDSHSAKSAAAMGAASRGVMKPMYARTPSITAMPGAGVD